jgi:hypothetical protein
LSLESQQRFALDTLLVGGYLVLSISPLFFFLVRRKEKTPLLFGLFALAQTVYADMTGERLLLQLWAGPQTPGRCSCAPNTRPGSPSMALFLLLVHRMFRARSAGGRALAVAAACSDCWSWR